MSHTFALKTVSSRVLGLGIVLALTFAFFVFVFVFLVFAAFTFLAFAFTFAFLVALALLALSSFTQHREIHRYSITSGRIRLCSAVIEQHRPNLRVALQDVRVQVTVVLHLMWCQREYDTYLDVLIQRLAKPLFVFCHVAFPSLDCNNPCAHQ